MRILPAKNDIVPGLIIALAAIFVAGRVGFVNRLVYGAPKA